MVLCCNSCMPNAIGVNMDDDWVEDKFGEDIYLNEYQELDDEGLRDFCEDLIGKMKVARAAGWKDVYVQFSSTLEPYEDCYPGPVEIQIRGKRNQNPFEKAKADEYKRIQELADKLGITPYEAGVVDRLEKLKKIKL